MYKFTIEFAKLNIEVNCNYEYTKSFCRDYISTKKPDLSISVSEEEIDEEISVSPYNPARDYAESICVYREIAKMLPYYNKCVFHGAVIDYKNNGFLFTAPSGTGKTTHIRLWKKYIEGVEIINGDKPILSLENDHFFAYATAYAGKEGYENHGFTKLKAICLLKRGITNKIYRLSSSECLNEIVKQTYMPDNAEAIIKTIDLLDSLLKSLPVYCLECDISKEAVKCSFEGLTEDVMINEN